MIMMIDEQGTRKRAVMLVDAITVDEKALSDFVDPPFGKTCWPMKLHFIHQAQHDDPVIGRLIAFKLSGKPSLEKLKSESAVVKSAMHEWNRFFVGKR